MANSKSYSYQIKGNKISLLQDQYINDGASNSYGPDGKPSWTSPHETAMGGMEIEYAYSPNYEMPFLQPNINQFGLVGWTIVDGYLTFISSARNWTASPYNQIAANEYIYIGNSSRWSGIHKVQETQTDQGSHGGVKTYTKVNQSIRYFTDADVSWDEDSGSISDIDDNFDDVFKSNADVPYIWITGSSAANANNGLISGWDIDGTIISITDALYYYYNSGEALTLVSATPHFTDDTTATIYIREAFYDPCYIVSDINVLSDESDNIDLPEYLSLALVYYLKAKLAEDAGQLDVKEYNMREFRVMVEKHESSKIAGGSRRVMGFGF